jgi:TonB family protein
MKRITMLTAVVLALMAAAPSEAGPAEGQALLLRHALLVGGRDAAQVPITGEARSAEELGRFLVEWEPGEESKEIRDLFALEGLSEVVRQALVLPAVGGQSNSVYVHEGVSFEVRFDVRLADDDAVTAAVEIKRDGSWLGAPTVTTKLGERAIVSTTNGPEAPFLFLVVEVDRVSSEEIRRRGLNYAWRKDLLIVDGHDVTAPRAIVKQPPMYTEEARKERIEGLVILRLVIDETGEVSEVDVLKGLPFGLTETAVETVKKWKYEPARHAGKPVSVLYNITINFRLKEKLQEES